MPINEKMMKAMKKEYGKKKGESVYYAVENKKKMEDKLPTRGSRTGTYMKNKKK